MRRVNRDQAQAILRQLGMTLGEYSEGDSNTHNANVYNEREVFNAGGPGGGQQLRFTPGGDPILPPKTNMNSALLTPFVVANLASVQVCPTNFNRVLLLIQNLAGTGNIYFNLGSGATANNGVLLPAGQGIVLDWGCPNNSVFVISDQAAGISGIVLEVAKSGG